MKFGKNTFERKNKIQESELERLSFSYQLCNQYSGKELTVPRILTLEGINGQMWTTERYLEKDQLKALIQPNR